MIFNVHKPTLSEMNQSLFVKKGTLLIAVDSEFNLTQGRVYITTKDQGKDTFWDCVTVVNDEGKEDSYSGEYFMLYEGETVTAK